MVRSTSAAIAADVRLVALPGAATAETRGAPPAAAESVEQALELRGEPPGNPETVPSSTNEVGPFRVDGRQLSGDGAGAEGRIEFASETTATGHRAFAVLHDEEAPDRIEWDLPGHRLELRDDGGVDVLRANRVVASISPPWALDAEGSEVPTRYEVQGSTLRQVVDHEGARYPVVADPEISFGLRAYVTFTLAETLSIRTFLNGPDGESTLVGTEFVCTLIPNLGVRSACVVSVPIVYIQLADLFSTAALRGDCVELGIPYGSPIVPGPPTLNIVNC